MKITVSKNELLKKLLMVRKIITTSKTTPDLEFFKFDCGEHLRVTGSDINGSITASIDCKIENLELFTLLIDAKIMIDALKELSEQPIEIDVKGSKVTVIYHNGTFELIGGNANSYPVVTIPEDAFPIVIEKQKLIDGIKSVSLFTATDELRPVMSGVNIQSKDGVLTFVATDATKLGIHEYESDYPDFSSIIPKKTAKLICDLISEMKEDTLTLTISSKNISLNTGVYSLIYRLIEGRYPNFRGVIPQNNPIELQTNRSDLMGCIRRISVFSNKNTSLIKLDLSSDSLKINSQDIDFSLAAEELLKVDYSGDPLTIGFSGTALLEVLGSISSEECLLTFSTPGKAALVTPMGVEGITLLIMPTLVNN